MGLEVEDYFDGVVVGDVFDAVVFVEGFKTFHFDVAYQEVVDHRTSGVAEGVEGVSVVGWFGVGSGRRHTDVVQRLVVVPVE